MSLSSRTASERAHHFLENPNSSLQGSVLYENSVHEDQNQVFFLIRHDYEKYLIILGNETSSIPEEFSGEKITGDEFNGLVCPLTHENAVSLRKRFSFTKPVLIGKSDSYGFGDRLGNAGAAHLRAVKGTDFRPVLAQQSIRELERTSRSADDVLDASSWAVFQEGYHDGFGADGDHLKSPEHLDIMVKAGYTMFTIDPSDYVVDEAGQMSDEELLQAYNALPWKELEIAPDVLLQLLSGKSTELPDGHELKPSEREVWQGMVKYGQVLAHTVKMSRYMSENYPNHPAELELSIDETDVPTTLFEHFLVASQLQRLGVELVSLAPRFCGDFEKGIDFKGDLNQFRDEYSHHLAIAEMFGGYKLSIHSGSDKFSVYEVVGSLDQGAIHVKTAGTSYLEALRTVAAVDPSFFREIMHFAFERFEVDRKTYHISADVNRASEQLKADDKKLASLLNNDDVRQVLHVTYGSVLTGGGTGSESYKSRLMNLLAQNEDIYEQFLTRHFEKHLNPFH